MGKVEPRTVTPFLKAFRNFLLGRGHVSPLRFEDYYAARTQPPPELPDGPCHKLSANYYCTRDGRREVAKPLLLASPDLKLIKGKGSEAEGAAPASRTPGVLFKYST